MGEYIVYWHMGRYIAVRCDTDEEADQVIEMLMDSGYTDEEFLALGLDDLGTFAEGELEVQLYSEWIVASNHLMLMDIAAFRKHSSMDTLNYVEYELEEIYSLLLSEKGEYSTGFDLDIYSDLINKISNAKRLVYELKQYSNVIGALGDI